MLKYPQKISKKKKINKTIYEISRKIIKNINKDFRKTIYKMKKY